MVIHKAIDQRAKYADRTVAVIEPARHPNAVRKWEIWWASGRGADWFTLLSDAMGFVRRFYPEVRFEKVELGSTVATEAIYFAGKKRTPAGDPGGIEGFAIDREDRPARKRRKRR